MLACTVRVTIHLKRNQVIKKALSDFYHHHMPLLPFAVVVVVDDDVRIQQHTHIYHLNVYNTHRCCCCWFLAFFCSSKSRKQIVKSRPIHIGITASKHTHSLARIVTRLRVYLCVLSYSLARIYLCPQTYIHTHNHSHLLANFFSARFVSRLTFVFILFYFFCCFVLSYSTHFLLLFGWFRVDATSMRVLYYSCYLLLHFAAIFGHLFYFWIYHILLNRSNAM